MEAIAGAAALLAARMLAVSSLVYQRHFRFEAAPASVPLVVTELVELKTVIVEIGIKGVALPPATQTIFFPTSAARNGALTEVTVCPPPPAVTPSIMCCVSPFAP